MSKPDDNRRFELRAQIISDFFKDRSEVVQIQHDLRRMHRRKKELYCHANTLDTALKHLGTFYQPEVGDIVELMPDFWGRSLRRPVFFAITNIVCHPDTIEGLRVTQQGTPYTSLRIKQVDTSQVIRKLDDPAMSTRFQKWQMLKALKGDKQR